MRVSLRSLLLLLVLAVPASMDAEPLERDLGRGLAYLRVARLPTDLPTKSLVPQNALVLDLRFVSADANSAQAFAAWLRFRANATTPISILVNGETDARLLHGLLAAPALSGVVTLGPAASAYQPDVAVNVSPETDRRAYEALAAGTAVEDLIARKLAKPRHDEALLVRHYTTGVTAEGESETDGAPAKPPTTVAPIEPPTTDLVLARAVQLHRALLALRRIP